MGRLALSLGPKRGAFSLLSLKQAKIRRASCLTFRVPMLASIPEDDVLVDLDLSSDISSCSDQGSEPVTEPEAEAEPYVTVAEARLQVRTGSDRLGRYHLTFPCLGHQRRDRLPLGDPRFGSRPQPP